MAPVALSCTAARLARPVCVQEAQSSIAAPASLRGATGLRLGRSARALGSSSSSFLPQAAQQQRQSQPGRPARRCGLQCSAAAGGAAAWAAAAFDAPDGSSAVDYTKRHRFPAFLAAIRAVLFYTTTLIFAMPLFVLMLLAYPYCLQFDKYRRRAEHVINTIWAKLTTMFYYPVEIKGLENLPGPEQAAVYVANHASFLDIYTLFHLQRDFKFISKTSNFMIPIIGWSMFLTGHVMINRVDRRSQLECLKQCGELLKQGASVLFFPEGTRTKRWEYFLSVLCPPTRLQDGRMHSFKKGAFSVAAKAKVPVVPITLVGTGDLMPNAKEYLLYPGKVQVIIHPLIQPTNADSMSAAAHAAIASSLPPELVAPPEDAAKE